MILTKSRIYENKLISSLKHKKILLRDYRTNEIPNWKRRRLSVFLGHLGFWRYGDNLSDLAITTERKDLLEYYGDDAVIFMRSCVEGNRPDIMDNNLIRDYALIEYQDPYDIQKSLEIALEKRNYAILFYLWDIIVKENTCFKTCNEKILKYLPDYDKLCKEYVPTTWD